MTTFSETENCLKKGEGAGFKKSARAFGKNDGNCFKKWRELF